MSTYSYFIIRHTPTGFVIAPAKGRDGRGGSHVEPSAGRPRLFDTERAAKGWLTTWLKGKVTTDGFYTTYEGDYEETLRTEPVPSRKREEMEIVKVELTT